MYSTGPSIDYPSIVLIAKIILVAAAVVHALKFVILCKNDCKINGRNDCKIIGDFQTINCLKHFLILVAAVSFESVYTFVAIAHSIFRIRTEPMNLGCFDKYNLAVGGMASVLIAIVPLILAVDRLIVSLFGKWYYRQTTNFIVLIGLALGISIAALINYYKIATAVYTLHQISEFCLNYDVLQPELQLTFFQIKAFFIVLAGVVYAVVIFLYYFHLDSNYLKCTSVYISRIRSGYFVMGCLVYSSFIFVLLPEYILYYFQGFWTTTISQSVLIIKPALTVLVCIRLHKEFRDAYKQAQTNVVSVAVVTNNIELNNITVRGTSTMYQATSTV
ncbi:hypothetical protein B9Z55_016213 [Caenorhabditis nigoni]|nr:hypothetical protein B9Z55_016213 [Caenorhabditis nigoni]